MSIFTNHPEECMAYCCCHLCIRDVPMTVPWLTWAVTHHGGLVDLHNVHHKNEFFNNWLTSNWIAPDLGQPPVPQCFVFGQPVEAFSWISMSRAAQRHAATRHDGGLAIDCMALRRVLVADWKWETPRWRFCENCEIWRSFHLPNSEMFIAPEQ